MFKQFIGIALPALLIGCTKVPYTKPYASTPQADASIDAAIKNNDFDKRVLIRHFLFNGATIIEEKRQLHIIVPPSANFEPHDAVIPANFMGLLDYVVAYLDAYPRSHLIIIDNENNRTEKVNYLLFTKRAVAITAYLESQGVAPERIEISGRTAHNHFTNKKLPPNVLAMFQFELILVS